MINTKLKEAKKWYYDAVIGCIILQGYSKKESKQIVNSYGLKRLLNTYTLETFHTPVESTAADIMDYYRKGNQR